jgi:hypothetical protein
VLRERAREMSGGPDNFYHMIVVDAFSSDAIPRHLITKEAIQMYFKKLAPDGILCVHTSNRYVDLVPVVADAARELGLASVRGHTGGGKERGHFSSEWVMVARDQGILNKLKEPPTAAGQRDPYWSTPSFTPGRHMWTDDYSNLWGALRKR